MCIYIYINIYIYIYRYIYIHIYIYIHTFLYTELGIGSVASQSVNYFWVNCESLWQSNSQYCESLLGDM